MMAMQYSITLPADYDMSIIERRIAEKGRLLDGYPHLGFKAFLSARKGIAGSRDNLYAPFYVWEGAAGIADFLCGPGFDVLRNDFGRPSARTWVVWRAEATSELSAARFATREVSPIEESADLGALRQGEIAAAGLGRSVASVVGFEPTGWTVVRFRLWRDASDAGAFAGQAYDVGHVARSGAYA
jgi:hypothetical protein